MSLRRLHHEQPDGFAFTPANAEWAKRQIAKYPEGRQASAVIPLLWRAQEQEGWVTRPAIEEVASMLGMAEIRVLEVATFYFMFQLQPVGSVAHIQVCGTTSCMICGAEDLVAVCKQKIAPNPHERSADGKFSWEEVECLGACSNAPMVQIGKDYYEDLTAESLGAIIDAMARGEVPTPGPQNGRWASEPISGLTSLAGKPVHDANASVELARIKGDTIARITGGENGGASDRAAVAGVDPAAAMQPAVGETVRAPEQKPAAERATITPETREVAEDSAPLPSDEAAVASDDEKNDAARLQSPAVDGETPAEEPELLDGPRGGRPDDLKKIKGVGPKLEGLLHELGIYHFDQIANWTAAEVAWVDDRLSFKGRIERDGWIEQARALISGGGDD